MTLLSTPALLKLSLYWNPTGTTEPRDCQLGVPSVLRSPAAAWSPHPQRRGGKPGVVSLEPTADLRRGLHGLLQVTDQATSQGFTASARPLSVTYSFGETKTFFPTSHEESRCRWSVWRHRNCPVPPAEPPARWPPAPPACMAGRGTERAMLAFKALRRGIPSQGQIMKPRWLFWSAV